MEQKKFDIILHAPNVHSGGGMVLLSSLLSSPTFKVKFMQLDFRVKHQLHFPVNTSSRYVYRSVFSRLCAELRLWQHTKASDVVLCFHGLPPLLPLRGRVVVFVQNRLLFEISSLEDYPFFIRYRLMTERLWTRLMQRNCNQYIVQTPSMKNIVLNCLGVDCLVNVMPFAPTEDSFTSNISSEFEKKYDFVYVSSGEAHKNHINLLEAWRLLADVGFRPSLALTINRQSFPDLSAEISSYILDYGLNIINLDQVPITDISNLYLSSGALIFPSKTESFGLPLIEAFRLGVPTLASELDYVRDLINPVDTFDPNSPISIARAVRRFLGCAEPTVQIRSVEEFFAEVIK